MNVVLLFIEYIVFDEFSMTASWGAGYRPVGTGRLSLGLRQS